MKASKKTIQFVSICSAVFLVITYLISINFELGFIVINSKLISGNFLLTVFGGAFASMLVVLFCEIQKYYSTKKETETYLFYHSFYLYQFLFLLRQNIKDYQENKNEQLYENLMEDRIRQIQNEIFMLQNVTYLTFSKKNRITKGHRDLIMEINDFFLPINQGNTAFKIALIQTRIKNAENGIQKIITAEDELVKRVLEAQQRNISNGLNCIEAFIELIDESCKGKYEWAKSKESVASSYISIFDAWSFDKFINKEG